MKTSSLSAVLFFTVAQVIADITFFSVDRVEFQIAASEIYEPLRDRSENSLVYFYELKNETNFLADSKDFNLKKIHREAQNNIDEPFLKAGKRYFIRSEVDDTWWYIYIEDGLERFQIAPASKVGGNIYVVNAWGYISHDKKLLNSYKKALHDRKGQKRD